MEHLLNASEETIAHDLTMAGRFIETFVGLELLKQIDWSENEFSLLHYRTAAGREVDYVIEDAANALSASRQRLPWFDQSD